MQARLSEWAGLGLATFQDHPYQPRLLDSWTLISYLAAATSRIKLAPNVMNLPMRQPVVIARSAATLDLLSGGRVELALGTGAFWDAIEAIGGRRLAPGESVDALEEAITIIREIWHPERRGGVRMDGTHYHVAGGPSNSPRPPSNTASPATSLAATTPPRSSSSARKSRPPYGSWSGHPVADRSVPIPAAPNGGHVHYGSPERRQ
ncbi:LLM class flavin-dependent oxidoreductase [Streptomyces sp. WM6386]|uniref:LLM class flavin-dependent oxidoreductase n=1 Tax=Streptomyces sp. WM6386 TaxID=1415558 RepID=UPI000BA2362D|nr:LLM class flavin-dependent oxidoreductase [Streptomyces sp. WM6386]